MTRKQIEYLKLRMRPAVEGHVFLRDPHTLMYFEIVQILEDDHDTDYPIMVDARGGCHHVDETNWSDILVCDPVPNARRIQ